MALSGLKALNVLSTRKNPIFVELFDSVNDELIIETLVRINLQNSHDSFENFIFIDKTTYNYNHKV